MLFFAPFLFRNPSRSRYDRYAYLYTEYIPLSVTVDNIISKGLSQKLRQSFADCHR